MGNHTFHGWTLRRQNAQTAFKRCVKQPVEWQTSEFAQFIRALLAAAAVAAHHQIEGGSHGEN